MGCTKNGAWITKEQCLHHPEENSSLKRQLRSKCNCGKHQTGKQSDYSIQHADGCILGLIVVQ